LQRHQPDRLLRRERYVREDQGAERQLHVRPQRAGEAPARDQQPPAGGDPAQPIHLQQVLGLRSGGGRPVGRPLLVPIRRLLVPQLPDLHGICGDQLLTPRTNLLWSVRLMSSTKRIPEVLGLVTALVLAGACDTLKSANPNAPDSPRALTDPGTVQALPIAATRPGQLPVPGDVGAAPYAARRP